MKKIAIFLFDGFSDWEIAYLAPEIKKSKEFELIYFSKDGKPVCSMGGLQIQPNLSLSEIAANEVDVLVLPGGVAWEKGENTELTPLVSALLAQQKTVAAICAATTYLAAYGFLDGVRHTSNDLYYLKAIVPTYTAESRYITTPAITDQNIITANGIASIEFAREIFEKVKLYSKPDIEKWYQLFKNGIWSE
jgi:putative intracellular protease/amidase